MASQMENPQKKIGKTLIGKSEGAEDAEESKESQWSEHIPNHDKSPWQHSARGFMYVGTVLYSAVSS